MRCQGCAWGARQRRMDMSASLTARVTLAATPPPPAASAWCKPQAARESRSEGAHTEHRHPAFEHHRSVQASP